MSAAAGRDNIVTTSGEIEEGIPPGEGVPPGRGEAAEPPPPPDASEPEPEPELQPEPELTPEAEAEREREPAAQGGVLGSPAAPGGGGGAWPTVRMASTVCVPTEVPTAVFVHGLDSSKDTWIPVVMDLVKAGYPCVALDQRGHGESPLGDPAHFCPGALAADVFAAAESHGIDRPFVLVGHSMGGRISMRVAAMEAERVAAGLPPKLAAVVIEDIDTRRRSGPSPPDEELSEEQRQQLRRWEGPGGRLFPSWEACEAALLPWYDNDRKRIQSWRGPNASTRVSLTKAGTGYWCDHNPAARRLAQKTVLDTDDAVKAWSTMATAAHADVAAGRPCGCPIYLWISAEKGTVCNWDGPGGLHEMIAQFPAEGGGGGGCLEHKVFPGSSHCIHRSRRKDYVADLKRVLNTAAGARQGLAAFRDVD
jgi:pimeloyl-ACP methyl ester carboxylesterase